MNEWQKLSERCELKALHRQHWWSKTKLLMRTLHDLIPGLRLALGPSPVKLMNFERERLSLLRDKLGTSRSGGKVADVTTQLKGLKEFIVSVEGFIHRKFPPQQGGASAPSDSHTSGCIDHTASNRPTHAAGSTAASRAGAIRVEISDSDQWSPGDVAFIQNQEAKRVREIGSQIFDTPLQNDYEAGVEVRSLLRCRCRWTSVCQILDR